MTQTLPKLSKPVRSVKNGESVVHAYNDETRELAQCILGVAASAAFVISWAALVTIPPAFVAMSVVGPTVVGLTVGLSCS